MKNLYLIFNKDSGDFAGYTPSKSIIKRFIKSRKKGKYNINKINPDDLHESCVNEILSYDSPYELVGDNDKPMFVHEEQFLIESLEQFYVDLEIAFKDLKYILKFFKFNKYEKQKIKETIHMFEQLIDLIRNLNDSGDEECELYNHINMDKMVDYIIEQD